ncbi:MULTISPECIES: AraC family transcriptional regulator [unclassified Sinorhizobium]|uniref:AraC family transcriptional regulator n=1 Tax=unclassified Sinorhizobium TaxID=2613772 RepID=UPI0035234875
MTRGRFRLYRCAIAGVEAVEAETRHSFPRHTHEQFGIGVIYRGAQKSLSGRGMVEAGAGDVITVNPNEVHDGAPIGDDRWWRILYFEPGLIGDVVCDVTEGRSRAVEIPRPVIHEAAIAARFDSLFSAAIDTEGSPDSLQRDELFLRLVADVMCDQTEAEGETGVPESIRLARGLIDDDPTATVTLSDLARVSGLNRFQVLRAFARVTGLTPHAYLVQRRVHLARRLIAKGTALAEAALVSGFADQSHMTRVFVRNYGISPGVYAEAVS